MLLSFSELDVLIYQGKVGGLFRERKNERVATDIDSRNKSSSSSHEYDSVLSFQFICDNGKEINVGNDSNLLIVFYVQIMPDDFVMQLHR
ncbi:hypothetical protein NPS64_20630, partial [Escherichia coli]|nr:hypothetical protein [Escherichia coli]